MTDTPTAPKQLDGWRKIAVDFGPLLFFFLAYNRPAPFQRVADSVGLGKLLAPIPGDPGILMATAVFMVATAIAMAYSFAKTRHVPAMIWFSALLVGFFGGLTIWLRDETFIKMKPTLVYLIFAAILIFGLMTKRNYLQRLLGAAFAGLSDRGWHLLAWRWSLFFIALAVLNEVFWRFFSTDIWVHFKVWGDTLLTFGFALAQMPMLQRHGLILKDKPAAETDDKA